ncbi:MAG TPA: hypothetical protein VFJ47_06295, partial [Terriglobales bacterium]|nr:hypothetical protein [Terriglobales bacterium]
PPGGSPAPGQPRFSEVLVGKIQGDRVTAYLRKNAKSVDTYGTKEIFNLAVEGRTLRVAVLGVDTVAISNHDDPAVIRGIIDRSRKLASPFAGPALLRQQYKHVPIASLAWAIARIQPDRGLFAQSSLSFLFPRPAILVISARHLRALHLKTEAFTATPEDAHALAEKLTTFLSMFHAAETSVGAQGTDADVKSFFDSLKVEQENDRAILTATVPPGFLRKALTEAPAVVAPAQPPTGSEAPPATAPEPAPHKKRKHPPEHK